MPLRAAFILLLLGLTGCAPPTSAHFDVSGDVAYPECFGKAFPFAPIFAAYRERADSVGLFFQSRGGNPQSVDVVYLEVFAPADLPVGTAIPMDAKVGPDTVVSNAVELSESCPDLSDALYINGTVTFDEFSQEIDGVIAGTIDGALANIRDGAIVADSFTGDFNFTVQVGQPYEEFRN